jgi:hypothetical protein
MFMCVTAVELPALTSVDRERIQGQSLLLTNDPAMDRASSMDPLMWICTGCNQYRLQSSFAKGEKSLRTCAICRNKHAKGRAERPRTKRPRDDDDDERKDAQGSPDDQDYTATFKQPRLTAVSSNAEKVQTV